MKFRIEIENIKPISRLVFDLDLSNHCIHCIAGKNGVGKTTLAKAVLNFSRADTFIKTSLDSIFDASSKIQYTIDETTYLFTYDTKSRSITTRDYIAPVHKAIATVELAAPHGKRFIFFRDLAEWDQEIRQAVVLGKHKSPTELIQFLVNIYPENTRFKQLAEIEFSRGYCCCFIQENKNYQREDYFSAGEYFLINLYRMIAQGKKLVFIDEIDVSIDASAQVRLAEELRKLCRKFGSTVVFTSHSLALMQTLEPEKELKYLELDESSGETVLKPISFNGVKSVMFQFTGFDRYIITEDAILEQFIRYMIHRYCTPTFYQYQVIFVGGSGYINKMIDHNKKHKIFGSVECVMGVKDGDQKTTKQLANVFCVPIPNVETEFFEIECPGKNVKSSDHKKYFNQIINKKNRSKEEIFEKICDAHNCKMKKFAETHLSPFLCRT